MSKASWHQEPPTSLLICASQADTAADVQCDHFQGVSRWTMWCVLAQEGLHGHHK